jgi:hypothetical protein
MKKAEALEARQTEMAVTLRKLKGLSVTEGNPLPRARRKLVLLFKLFIHIRITYYNIYGI